MSMIIPTNSPEEWCNIYIPGDKEYHGYNDQFAIVKYEHVLPYSHRLQQMAWYRRNIGFITSEKYTKFIVDKYYQINKIHFPFELERPVDNLSKLVCECHEQSEQRE